MSRAERGLLDTLALRAVRAICAALEVRLELLPRWRGAELDRLLDGDHALLVGVVVRLLEYLRWEVAVEVTYSRYGERGSIDILALHRATTTLLVVEVKTQLASVEELRRRLDQKVRLAPSIAVERFGLRPGRVAKLIVLPNLPTERRRVARHRTVIARIAPIQGARTVRRWLRKPSGELSALWFVSSSHGRTGKTVRLSGKSAKSGSGPTTRACGNAPRKRLVAGHGPASPTVTR